MFCAQTGWPSGHNEQKSDTLKLISSMLFMLRKCRKIAQLNIVEKLDKSSKVLRNTLTFSQCQSNLLQFVDSLGCSVH